MVNQTSKSEHGGGRRRSRWTTQGLAQIGVLAISVFGGIALAVGAAEAQPAPPPPAPSASPAAPPAAKACHVDGDCNPGTDGSGLRCFNQICTPGCNKDWQCPGTQQCVAATHQCSDKQTQETKKALEARLGVANAGPVVHYEADLLRSKVAGHAVDVLAGAKAMQDQLALLEGDAKKKQTMADSAKQEAARATKPADKQRLTREASEKQQDAATAAKVAKSAADAAGAATTASSADVQALQSCADRSKAAANAVPAQVHQQCGDCAGAICSDVDTAEVICSPSPERVTEGDVVVIKVVGRLGVDQAQIAVSAHVSLDSQQDSSVPPADAGVPSDAGGGAGVGVAAAATDGGAPAGPADTIAAAKAECADAPAKVTWGAVVTKSFTVPGDARARRLYISMSSSTSGKSSTPLQPFIDHGNYYLEAGLLLGFLPHGSRTVVQSPIPGTGGQQTLTVEDTWKVVPAIVLNGYPWGHRKHLYSPFDGVDGGSLRDWRIWMDNLGLQAGVGLDFSHAPTFFLGGTLTPITGVGFNLGAVILQGQYVPPNYAANMLVPHGETVTPDNRYFVSWYFGMTATTDVVNLLSTALSSKPTFNF